MAEEDPTKVALDIEAEGEQETSVRVFIRIRPLNKRELNEKQIISWNYNKTAMLEETQNGVRVYAFDQVFGIDSTNQETYDTVGRPVVIKAMEGFNGTVFTYGQTGSGKTWTMRGCDADPGMMILCIRDIFEYVAAHKHKNSYGLRVSYIEVYNEEINDLLCMEEGAGKNLKITAEDAARGAVIGTLVEELVTTPDEFMQVLFKGEANRNYASTSMNDNSSRSHVIYRVAIEIGEVGAAVEVDPLALLMLAPGAEAGLHSRISYMNLVDLAGSERQKSTNATGKTLKEGANINKSLLALGAVIGKLAEAAGAKKGAKAAFVPYRDSKLTRILKQSLGGNTLTSILVACSPAGMNREETVSSLKFGQMCKKIKNNVSSNVQVDPQAEMKKLKVELEKMKEQLAAGGGGGGGRGPAMAAKEREEYSQQFEVMKDLLVKSGVDLSTVSTLKRPDPIPVAAGRTGGGIGGGGGGGGADLQELNEALATVADLSHRLRAVQGQLAEHADLADTRAAIEDYEKHSRDELAEEAAKLEQDKKAFSIERYAILQDRSQLDEKELRVGGLVSNIDEKDSKLRQLLSTLKEQQEQWHRAVGDLKKREDLVDEWQKNHRSKEKRLEEIGAAHQAKFEQLNAREKGIIEHESRIKLQSREVIEREQRLQVSISRTSKAEQDAQAWDEQLKGLEQNLVTREHDVDIRDREMKSRRRELESWDLLLRQKDKKLQEEQVKFDEREKKLHEQEDEIRLNVLDYENNETDRKARELQLISQADIFKANKQDLADKEKLHFERVRGLDLKIVENDLREADLTERETLVTQLMQEVADLEERESILHERVMAHKEKENEFFNVQVKQITARHAKEMTALEDIVQQQIGLVSAFQAELERARTELTMQTAKSDEYLATLTQRERLVDQLRGELRTFADRGYGDAFADPIQLLSPLFGAGEEKSAASKASDKKTSSKKNTSAGDGETPDAAARMQGAGGGAKKELVMQLADTQRLLHTILQTNASTPSKKAALLRKEGSTPTRSLNRTPRTPTPAGPVTPGASGISSEAATLIASREAQLLKEKNSQEALRKELKLKQEEQDKRELKFKELEEQLVAKDTETAQQLAAKEAEAVIRERRAAQVQHELDMQESVILSQLQQPVPDAVIPIPAVALISTSTGETQTSREPTPVAVPQEKELIMPDSSEMNTQTTREPTPITLPPREPTPLPTAGGASARTTPVGDYMLEQRAGLGLSPAPSPLTTSISPSPPPAPAIVLSIKQKAQPREKVEPYIISAAAALVPNPVPAVSISIGASEEEEFPGIPFMLYAPSSGSDGASTPQRPTYSEESTPYVAIASSGYGGGSATGNSSGVEFQSQSQPLSASQNSSLRSGVRQAAPPPRSYAAPLARHSAPKQSPAQEAYARMHTPISAIIGRERQDRERAEKERTLRLATRTPQSLERSGTTTAQFSSSRSGGRTSHQFDIDAPELKQYIGHGNREGVPVTRVKAGYGSETKRLINAAKKAHENMDEDDDED